MVVAAVDVEVVVPPQVERDRERKAVRPARGEVRGPPGAAVVLEPALYAVAGVQRPAVDDEFHAATGKIYYDLVGHPAREGEERVAVGRFEFLYPFPEAPVLELVERYPNLREVVWVQEEPRNMGARAHMSPRRMQILPEHLAFGYIGRPERASPREGYPGAHVTEQSRIIGTALDLGVPVTLYPRSTPGER